MKEQAYNYILTHSGSQFLTNKQLWTAYITLGYDYQNYGNSEEEAKDVLATVLSNKLHIQQMIADHNN